MATKAKQFYEREYQGAQYANVLLPQAHAYHDLVRDLVTRYGLSKKKCLEVGCGRGAFQDMVEDWTGVDLSEHAGHYIHKPFVACDARSLPFPDSTFDAAWSIAAIEHVPQPERALREIRRVLKDGGVALLAPAWHTRPWFANGYPVRPYSDLTIFEKIVKATIPFRDFRPFRHSCVMARRVTRLLLWLCRFQPDRFHYRKLRPNYETFWMSDSDAVNSMDPFDMILWFIHQRDACKSHPKWYNWLMLNDLGVVFEVRKGGGLQGGENSRA